MSPVESTSSKFPFLLPNRRWVIFQKSGFDIVTKPEPRDFILSYLSLVSLEKEEIARNRNLTSRPYLINMKIQELSHLYGYS